VKTQSRKNRSISFVTEVAATAAGEPLNVRARKNRVESPAIFKEKTFSVPLAAGTK
jgi:hypothetical protein